MRHLFLGILSLCVLMLPLSARAADPDADVEKAVKDRTAEFVKAWNEHDPAALAMFWLADGDLIGTDGTEAKGREKIQAFFKTLMDGPMKGSTNDLQVTHVRKIGDAAVVDWSGRVSGMKSPDGADEPPMEHHVVVVMQMENGKWMFAAARPYVLQPKMPATQP